MRISPQKQQEFPHLDTVVLWEGSAVGKLGKRERILRIFFGLSVLGLVAYALVNEMAFGADDSEKRAVVVVGIAVLMALPFASVRDRLYLCRQGFVVTKPSIRGAVDGDFRWQWEAAIEISYEKIGGFSIVPDPIRWTHRMGIAMPTATVVMEFVASESNTATPPIEFPKVKNYEAFRTQLKYLSEELGRNLLDT